MTEAEWLACDNPDRMLRHLLGRERARGFLALLGLRRTDESEPPPLPSERKLRLFVAACCSRIDSLLRDERSRNAIQASVRYADGLADPQELFVARADAWSAVEANDPSVFAEYASLAGGAGHSGKSWFWAARAAAKTASEDIEEVLTALPAAERAAIEAATEARSAEPWAKAIGAAVRAGLAREVFGNPFNPAPLPSAAVLAWNDATVPRIAQGIYEEQAFDRLPILADALLDAGCDDDALIAHCRNEGPHVRGCWAVDAILDKS
jgi:hypothetical protein